ncbi:MAG: D-tyrosyl-tRNA(Tyr) deacylase [Planctomycetia bacterium]|jgi:D-tyrosyl-tRNA(Tyr) deacylase|nr:D-tyrosyl-tRNA(Tyr) deacylase [Planctomycetia bacterium]
MRAVVQRVRSASVTVEDDVVGEIGTGFLVLLGVATGDGDEDGTWMARKIAGLRVFPDEAGRMNLDLAAAAGEVLLVSQFTLQADCRRGNRPSFIAAAAPEIAAPAVDRVATLLRDRHGLRVETGRFGASMAVRLLNDGPVTIVLDSTVDGHDS